MRLLFLVLSSVSILAGCGSGDSDALSIVERAYEAHGGKATWDELIELHYEKESMVYNADGSIRLQNVQQHHYEMKPEFRAIIHWNTGDQSHEIWFTDAGAEKWVDGEQIRDEKAEASAYESVNAARYTVSQPFKLSDPGVVLTYEGEDVLEEGQRVYVIKASYSTENESHTKNDEWWYYFDVNTFFCLATMVHHGNSYSYIKNLEYDRTTDIVFNHHRKGYAVDSARNILYHQSEYFYRNFAIVRSDQ